ncbi:MAG: ABC transporter permease subunit [Sciscionella sp.]|nr:ABC transporter permease subunit [Sciscionella sp.]
MTAATLTVRQADRARTHAPLTRLLISELRFIYRRPRTLIALGALALVPIAIGIGVAVAGDNVGGPDIIASLFGNGLALPIAALTLSMVMLLPLLGSMAAADALSGESANGTLRGLLVAPVGRVRLLGMKAFGVGVFVLSAAFVIGIVGLITGLILLGGNGMITMSGSTLSFGAGLGRVLLAVLWIAFQVFAVASVAMAISACTDHPLIVMAATLAGIIVFGVLSTIPQLDWLQPYLITTSWSSVTDFLRDPVPTSGLLTGLARAACYAGVGLSLAMVRLSTKDG